MDLRVAGYQFLSRDTAGKRLLGRRRCSPRERPDVVYETTMEVQDKLFETNFAQLLPSRPSIGASEYVDPEVDVYMSRRWPKCVALTGGVTIPEKELVEPLTRQLLTFVRKLLWAPGEAYTYPPDQRACVLGYRREHFGHQMFDISGNRRPSSVERYVPTDLGELVSPGVASLPDVRYLDSTNELVWSPILPFPNRRGVEADLPEIRRCVAALKKHYNGYNELRDAHRHIERGEVKAAVRAAASAVDAVLHYYCDLWSLPKLPKHLAFDEKIEWLLQAGGRPSYRMVDSDNLDRLLYLYRCRNSMHEGDCCFHDRAGIRRTVRGVKQVQPFVDTAEEFVLWIDALA